jgi:hypothetical protein
VELQNATSGEPGRAVRLFPDGSFDGFAPLSSGKNELRLTAVSEGGARATVTRFVTFEKALPDPEKLERFRKQLEIRAVETELYERARSKRAERLKKELQVQPER